METLEKEVEINQSILRANKVNGHTLYVLCTCVYRCHKATVDLFTTIYVNYVSVNNGIRFWDSACTVLIVCCCSIAVEKGR